MVPSKHVVGTSGCTDHPLVTYCMSEYVSVHMYVYFYFIFTCILLLLMKREESERKKRLCVIYPQPFLVGIAYTEHCVTSCLC